jgi:uncharacterized membrane protein
VTETVELTPLIEADQTFALAAIIMVIVAAGMWAETRRWGQHLGGPLVLLAISMALANFGLIPHAAPMYDAIATFLVPAAIPLLLMRADFRTIFSESGPVFVAFLVAAAVTIAGALAGVWAVDMGQLEAEIAGTVASSYIGGSLNFVATAEVVGIKDSSMYVAALSADAVGAVFYLLVLMSLPAIKFVRAALPSRFLDQRVESESSGGEVPGTAARPFRLAQAANGLAVSLMVCWGSAEVTEFFDIAPAFILVVTAMSLLVANLGAYVVRHVSSEFELGTLFMYVFFVVIGAGANIADVLGTALPILMFIVVMVVVHLCLLVMIGKLMKLDLAEIMIASNACILGPATAAALAASRGWQPLIAPGILVGMFGYAIATFIGVALTAMLR